MGTASAPEPGWIQGQGTKEEEDAAPSEPRSPVRVLAVEDHAFYRAGLVRLLTEAGVDVVGEAGDGAAGIRLALQLAPEVVLMDVRLPDMSGVEATRLIAASAPGIHIVVLSVVPDEDAVVEALAAGASGYLLKDASIEDIVSAIYGAARGECVVSRAVADKLVNHVRRQAREPSPDPPRLTARELDILRLLAQGLDNSQIGGALFLSQSTVKHHVSRILAKLEVDNRIQAAVRAVRDGLLDL